MIQMKWLQRFLIVFCALISFSLFAQQNTAKKPLNILTLGDSNGSFPYSWPRQLQLMLPDATVFNISKSGRTIGFVNLGDSNLNSLMMLETNLAKADAQTNGVPYNYIVMELGTNDAKAIFADRQNEVPANLEKLIQRIRKSTYATIKFAKIIIIAPPPYGMKTDTTKKYTGGNARVKMMSQTFEAVATRNGCRFVNGYELIGKDIEDMSADGIHLNAAASQLLVEHVAKMIQQSLLSPYPVSYKVRVSKLHVKAPFEIPSISVPDYSRTRTYDIRKFGAVPGDKVSTSQAIATAIEKAHQARGGIVSIPAGEWLTGKIHLKSNVNLHLEKNAVLLFSENPDDYLPAVHSSWEGMECYNYSPLIYAYGCTNVSITGEGELKAKMDVWTKWFARPAAHMESIKRLYNWAWNYTPLKERNMVNDTSHLRPQFIQFNRCTNVLLEGVSIRNSPFWTIHLYLSKDIVIRNIHVYAHGHNNDGVDPEMSQNVLIENSVFDQGDDAVAIKSGRNPEGWRLKTPSKNIVIRNCLVKNGHQLVAIGSELSGGIENVFIDSCVVENGAKLNHLLFIKTNERMGGYVKNIHATNIKAGSIDLGVLGIETDVLYQWKTLVPTYEKRLTPIRDVYMENVQVDHVKFVSRILAQPSLPVIHVSLKNITTGKVTEEKHIHKNVEDFDEQKVSFF